MSRWKLCPLGEGSEFIPGGAIGGGRYWTVGIQVATVEPPNKGHFRLTKIQLICREVFLFGRFKMYCRNYTGTVSRALCREVYCTVSLFGRVHYQRFSPAIVCLEVCVGEGGGVCKFTLQI